jgi:hypothetical protein
MLGDGGDQMTAARRRKRGYSRAFTPSGTPGHYLLGQIPAGLWRAAKAKAKRDGVSIRFVLLRALQEWTAPVERKPRARAKG